ncbi:uncharacterized protein LOC131330605 isoform X2 [Rhododendron vialii]|uniref:uncharacterized protein LOC131330605 isoform X2 n=1 Tax=Rhododendron vialii TaxID=182163 RepID=UPI00265DD00B|nr:uncharacterized protein LOC131330605 isoform X2 [Rhododendron vialii]
MTSAVAKLKEITTMEIVQQALEDLDFQDVSAKSLGGMDLIITFQSKEDRQAALRNPKIQGWFKSFKPWNGEPSGKSRLVWLKCRGIPLNVWSLSSFKRIGEIWGDFITLDQETLKEESYGVGRMMIASEYLNRIDEWINITVRGRNCHTRIWEEDCDDPFKEKHIRDWINNHISILVTNPKSREDVTGWDGDLAEERALDKPNLAELEAKSADKAVTEGNLTSTLLLKDGNSRIVHVPREDVIIANATAQEAEQSIVGESLAQNNQPIGNKEQQADLEEIPVKQAEVMHNQCVISNPDVQIVLQNVTNEAAAGDMLSSSSGVEKSAMGSGKVRGSVGERNVNIVFQNISLAPLTIIELHRNMQFPRAKLSNLVDDQVSWVANSVSEKLTSTEISREEYDEDEPLLDHNEDNPIEEEPILAPIKAAINGV